MILIGETDVLGEKHVPLPFYPRGRVVLEKLTVSQLIKKARHLMKPSRSLSSLQKPAICLYPEAGKSGPRPPYYLVDIHFNIIILSSSRFSNSLLYPGFPTK
jgi:hypothetical protein